MDINFEYIAPLGKVLYSYRTDFTEEDEVVAFQIVDKTNFMKATERQQALAVYILCATMAQLAEADELAQGAQDDPPQ